MPTKPYEPPIKKKSGVPPEVLALFLEQAAEQLKNKPAAETRPTTDDELHAWIKEVFGLDIPRTSVCAGHAPPFDFIADMFFHREDNVIVLANRGGGKTLYTAILEITNSYWKPGFSTAHFGAIDKQARRAYAYFKDFIRRKPFKLAIKETLQSSSTFINGSTLEIIAASERASQGAHTRFVSFDELESGNPVAYRNTLAIPTSWLDGEINRLGQYLVTSTRNSATGLMAKVLSDAELTGARVYAYCIAEAAMPCDENCTAENCNLYKWSDGNSRNATGWLSHEAVGKFYRTIDADTFDAQFLCKKPESKSFIYQTFSDANVSDEAEYVPDAGPIWCGYDWGFSDDTAIILCQYRDGQLFQFDELVGNGVSEQEWVERLVTRITELQNYDGPSMDEWRQVWKTNNWTGVRFPSVWVDIGAGDVSAVQMRQEFKIRGLAAAKPSRVKHQIVSGQDVVKAMMQPGPLGKPRYIVHPRCIQTIAGFQKYRSEAKADGAWGERPDPSASNHAFSHTCDAVRYLLWTVKKRFGLGGYTEEKD
jgi:hypothetical protein